VLSISADESEAITLAGLSVKKEAMQGSLKQCIQTLLRRVGLYERIKSSCLYDFYWSIADRRLIDDRSIEVEFYRNTLKGFRPGHVIFDVGANEGQKTDIFLRLGAKVVAVEPDERNQSILKQNFLSYRFIKKPVVIVGKALSDQNGAETMWIDEPGSAKNTLNPKWVETLRTDSSRFGKSLEFAQKKEVETITLEELIRSHGLPFYIKIDVEGYEAVVLRGLRSAMRYLSFEVNLPEFRPEALECIELLENVAAQGDFNYAPDCRHGLALERWMPKKEFVEAFNNCQEPCIEVFWKAPVSRAPST
jgi:FkbM family methyltransferase